VGREQVRTALESGGQRYHVSFDLIAINPSFVTGLPLLTVGARGVGEVVRGVLLASDGLGGAIVLACALIWA
jgi:hypothetical protein